MSNSRTPASFHYTIPSTSDCSGFSGGGASKVVQVLSESVEALRSTLHNLLTALLHPLTDCVDYCDGSRFATSTAEIKHGLAASEKKIQEMF